MNFTTKPYGAAPGICREAGCPNPHHGTNFGFCPEHLAELNTAMAVCIDPLRELVRRLTGAPHAPAYYWHARRVEDPAVPPSVCIFCMTRPATPTCTYGGAHECYAPMPVKTAPPKRVDARICTECGLHAKNPASATSGCGHTYPTHTS